MIDDPILIPVYEINDLVAVREAELDLDRAIQVANANGANPGDGSLADKRATAAQIRLNCLRAEVYRKAHGTPVAYVKV